MLTSGYCAILHIMCQNTRTLQCRQSVHAFLTLISYTSYRECCLTGSSDGRYGNLKQRLGCPTVLLLLMLGGRIIDMAN